MGNFFFYLFSFNIRSKCKTELAAIWEQIFSFSFTFHEKNVKIKAEFSNKNLQNER